MTTVMVTADRSRYLERNSLQWGTEEVKLILTSTSQKIQLKHSQVMDKDRREEGARR